VTVIAEELLEKFSLREDKESGGLREDSGESTRSEHSPRSNDKIGGSTVVGNTDRQ